jgi:hypothetical protein
MSLEALPLEIKCIIFRHLPYIQTLSALVHASPAYHAAYAAFREQIFTRFTILELQKRRVNVLTPGSFLEVNTVDNALPNPLVKIAILACHAAAHAEKVARLTIDQCLALLTLRDVVGWSVGLLDQEGAISAVVRSSHHQRKWVRSVQARQQTPMDIDRGRKKYRYGLRNYFILDLNFEEYPRLKPLYPRYEWTLHVSLEMSGGGKPQTVR